MLLSAADFEEAITRIERDKDDAEKEINDIERALSGRLQYLPGYTARTLRERLDKLRGCLPDINVFTIKVESKRSLPPPPPPPPQTFTSETHNQNIEIAGIIRLCNIHGDTVNITRSTQAIFLNDISNSTIKIGPCSGAAQLENISGCEIHLAAHQIRLWNCQNIRLWVHTPSAIVIEASHNVTAHHLDTSGWYEGFAIDLAMTKLSGCQGSIQIIDFGGDL